MAYQDLREFITKLEEAGELLRVRQEVDWQYEIGGWSRYSNDLRPAGPALLFENVRGYGPGYRVLTNAVGSLGRMAMALEADPDMGQKELIELFKERMADPIPPRLVSSGPVKQNVHLGREVDALEFPVPWWHPRDGGRFIGTWHGVVSRDLGTGRRNVGMYRVQVIDSKHCAIGFTPGQHIRSHFLQRERLGEPLDVAIVIGADETVAMSAATGIPLGQDEYALAGGMRGEPVDLVKCETVDLEVPANAEIVIEGRLHTSVDKRVPEGPFGEYLGYHGGSVRMRPLMEITAITHRDQPILRGALGGKPVTEWGVFFGIQSAAAGMRLFEDTGPAGVKAINNMVETGGLIATVIQVQPFYVGHSWEVARKWLSSQVGFWSKYVIVVDDDVDPFDLGQVFWAMASRTQGSRDIDVWRFCKSSRSDPSIPREQGEFTDRVIIDATKKLDYPYVKAYGGHWAPVSVPPKEVMDLVNLKWRREKGEGIPAEEIAAREKVLQEEMGPKWAGWREENYALTEEEKAREILLAYPRVEAGE